MIRRTLTFTFILLLSTTIAFCQEKNAHGHIREKDPEFKKNRAAWIDEMHRAEPGVDYRIIDAEVRTAMQRLRPQAVSPAIMKRAQEGLADTAIGGILRGEWRERGSVNLAGRTHTADFDLENGIAYIGSAGGNVWKGNTDGTGWKCLNNTQQFPDVRMVRALSRDGGVRIIAAANGPAAVYYTDDDGLTWYTASGLESPARWGSIRRAIVTNSSQPAIYVMANEWDNDDWESKAALYRSTDLGESFEVVSRWKYDSFRFELFDIWTPRYDADGVFLVHGDTLSRIQQDGGYVQVSIIPTRSDYAGYYNAHLQGFWKDGEYRFFLKLSVSNGSSEFYASNAGGETWEYRGAVTFHAFMDNSFAVSTVDSNLMFCGGVNCLRSTNGGESWVRLNEWYEYYGDPVGMLHADIPEISFFRKPGGGELIHFATDGGSYLSDDRGEHVRNISLSGLNVSQYYTVYTNRHDPDYVYAGSQDQGFQRCVTGGGGALEFTQLISGDYGHLTSSDDGTTLWHVYPGFAMLYLNSTDESPESYTWDFKGEGLWMPPITADPRDPNVAYLARGGSENDIRITKLTYSPFYGGIEPEVLPFNFSNGDPNTRISAIGISPDNPSRWYVLTNNGFVFASADDGQSWTVAADFQGPEAHYFYGSSILVSQVHDGRVIIAGSGYSNPGVYVSNDHGATFTPMSDGLPRTLVFELSMSGDEEFIYAATAAGPFVYIAARGLWYPIAGIDAPEQTYWCVDYIEELRTARFGTYGRGLWDFAVTEIVNVEPVPVQTSPGITLQAYPNPASNGTVFTFEASTGGARSLRVYDVQGRIVYDAPADAFAGGVQSLYWSGKSSAGNTLPAGVYLAVLGLNGDVAYTKVVLSDR